GRPGGWAGASSLASRPAGFAGDAVDLLAGADEEPAVGDGRGGQHLPAHVVAREDLECGRVGQHDDEAVLAGDVDLAVGGHRAGVVFAELADPLPLPQRLAGCDLEAARQPAGLDHEQPAGNHQGGGQVGGCVVGEVPQDVRLRDVTAAAAPDGLDDL